MPDPPPSPGLTHPNPLSEQDRQALYDDIAGYHASQMLPSSEEQKRIFESFDLAVAAEQQRFATGEDMSSPRTPARQPVVDVPDGKGQTPPSSRKDSALPRGDLRPAPQASPSRKGPVWSSRASSSPVARSPSRPEGGTSFGAVAAKARERREAAANAAESRNASKKAYRKAHLKAAPPAIATSPRQTRSKTQAVPPQKPGSPLSRVRHMDDPLSPQISTAQLPGGSTPGLDPHHSGVVGSALQTLMANKEALPAELQGQLVRFAAAPPVAPQVAPPSPAVVVLTPGQKGAETKRRKKAEAEASRSTGSAAGGKDNHRNVPDQPMLISSSPQHSDDDYEDSDGSELAFQLRRRDARRGAAVPVGVDAPAAGAGVEGPPADQQGPPAAREPTPEVDLDVENLPNPRHFSMNDRHIPCLYCIKVMAQDPNKTCTFTGPDKACEECRTKKRGYCQAVSGPFTFL